MNRKMMIVVLERVPGRSPSGDRAGAGFGGGGGVRRRAAAVVPRRRLRRRLRRRRIPRRLRRRRIPRRLRRHVVVQPARPRSARPAFYGGDGA